MLESKDLIEDKYNIERLINLEKTSFWNLEISQGFNLKKEKLLISISYFIISCQ
jgi:hypothetical protein